MLGQVALSVAKRLLPALLPVVEARALSWLAGLLSPAGTPPVVSTGLSSGQLDNIQLNLASVLKYLGNWGYIPKHVLDNPGSITIDEIIAAIQLFRKYFNIPTQNISLDGLIDTQLLTAMSYQRCGCRDHFGCNPHTEALTENIGNTGYWGQKELTWAIDSYVGGITKEQQTRLTTQMLGEISQVCGLTFRQVTSTQNANLVYTTGRTGELGQSGGVLAFAQLPPSRGFGGQLVCTYDLAERWIEDPRQNGIAFLNVASHESGHLLGLTHSSVKSALLAPFYNVNVSRMQSPDDIERLQAMYGPPRQVPLPPTIPTPPQNPVGGANINITGKVDKLSVDGWLCIKQ